MQVIILAGGEGKRMWPIQTDKCLLPFLGRPLLYHNLKQIKENFRQIYNGRDINVLIIASPQIKEAVTQVAKDLRFEFEILIQDQPKGMADALLSAKDLIAGEVIIINAGDILDPKVFKGVLGVAGDVVVTGLQVKSYFPGGYLKVEKERVKGIVEKPGEGQEPSDLVKLVVDYFKDGKKLVKYLQQVKTERDDRYEVALDQMIKDGIEVKFAKYDGVWIPLKYPWHILDITAYLLSKVEQKISPEAKISEKATIEGNVIIEDGVRVLEGAVIKGPCYIGKNCIVGSSSMIRESNLEAGCVTGFSSDITRSYIGANSWFHTNYVGDCVIEGDFGMGSGAVLANLRLDDHTIRVGEEKIDSGRHKLGLMAGCKVRVGVNASVMPGVRIGANSLIGPAVTLHQDIKENTKIILKQEYQISERTSTLTSYDQFRDKLK